jgi:hypothetical protein
MVKSKVLTSYSPDLERAEELVNTAMRKQVTQRVQSRVNTDFSVLNTAAHTLGDLVNVAVHNAAGVKRWS